ncbi:MAG: ABC transporter ATP-binding protein [Clostridia bacterium]|nr:ABC transporter ATP-binding protein [Clostridia bacterium]
MKKTKKPSTLRKVLGYIGKYKFFLPITLLFATVTVALTLYVPILIGDAIDLIVGKDNVQFKEITKILTLSAVLIAITALSQWIMSAINNRITYHVAADVRRDAFEKIEKLPLSTLDTKSHGDILSRTVNDTEQFSEGLLLGFTQLFTGILTILGTLGLLIYIRWQIALVVFVLTPLSLFIARFIAKQTYSLFKAQSAAKGKQTALIDEMLGNQKLVKAFAYENKAQEKFDKANDELQKCSLRAIFYSSITNPATRFIYATVYAAVALFGALTVISTADSVNPFTVGMLSCMLAYANQYTKPFNEISGVITEFQNSLACAGRVFELIEEKEEIPDADDAKELSDCDGEVSISDVSFSYVPEKPLIKNLNLSIKPGQRIAIVGPTGCGKTTLINLLMRFYDVCEGDISVDGISIKELKRRSLRKNYGMVLQDTWLKAGTIKENIIMGKPDATDDEIIAAAKASHAHSFIKRLPNGYDTHIGEDGGTLSQGQKQLLCITRIMLTLPPMLILDEATSSIDTRTEIKIQEAFLTMMQGRTSFIVAHRLSTIRNADVILVMRDGNIVEQGSHDELIGKGGFYFELYNSQFAH